MPSASNPPHRNRTEDASAPLAPAWHTAALVVLIVAVALTGSALQAHVGTAAAPAPLSPGQRLLAVYVPLLVVNGGLVLYVSRLFRTRSVLPELIGTRGRGLGGAACDLLLAVLGVALITGLEALFAPSVEPGRNAALRSLLPSTVAERLTWIIVSACVGFCEEVVYRGYLQQQLSAASRRVSIGIVLQAVLFGLAHLEQGFAGALRIAVYGLLLGVVARLRRSLLPGIACHIGIDLRAAWF